MKTVNYVGLPIGTLVSQTCALHSYTVPLRICPTNSGRIGFLFISVNSVTWQISMNHHTVFISCVKNYTYYLSRVKAKNYDLKE